MSAFVSAQCNRVVPRSSGRGSAVSVCTSMAGSRIFFSCICLNPFFTAKEYHGYDTLDYFHISPSLGLRVVIDGVFNHCSRHFFVFGDVVRNGERSQYKDWFYDLAFPVTRPP